MTPDTARLVLWAIALPMIAWTVLARIRWGHRWTTSVLLRRLFKRDPILGHLLQVFAFVLFVFILPDWNAGDLFLAWVVCIGLGHICW